MAATVNHDLHVSWHPLTCSDTSMRPNTLLTGKLTFLLLLVGGFPHQLFASFIPWGPAGDFPAWTGGAQTALAGVFFLAGAAILFNRLVRIASLAASAVVFLVLLLSQSAFHAGTILCGFILLLGGLQGPREHPSFVQWQIVVAHFALFLGATNGAEWTAALTAESWIPEAAGNAWLPALARLLQPGWFHHGFAWLVLTVELLLTIGLAVRPLRRPAVFVSLAFHSAVYGLMGTREVAVLVAAIAVGSLSFLRWPQTTITAIWPRSCGWPILLRRLIERTDWDQQIDWPVPRDPDGELVVRRDGTETRGWGAMCILLLFHPAFYFGLFMVATTLAFGLPPPWRAPINASIALGLILFFAGPGNRGARNRTAPGDNEPQ